MMNQTVISALSLLFGVAAGPTAWGGEPTAARYFDRHAEGWFWYEPEPEASAPVQQPEDPVSTPAPLPEAAVPAPAIEVEPPAPKPLSAAWFRENLDGYRDAALDDPSPANIEAYLYLQRIALERAGDFAEASAAAATRDPWLDANSERPLATYAARAVDAQAEAARTAVLKELAKEAGILFFYQANCPLCDSQADILKLANTVHGFEILPVSLDGSPPPGGFESSRLDDGQAETLGVVGLPATYLVQPPDLIALLAQAPLDLKTLGTRIISQAHAAGLIDDETKLATHALRRPFTLPADFDGLPPEVMDDPAALVAEIRRQLGMPERGDGS